MHTRVKKRSTTIEEVFLEEKERVCDDLFPSALLS